MLVSVQSQANITRLQICQEQHTCSTTPSCHLQEHTAHSNPSNSCTLHLKLAEIGLMQVRNSSREFIHYGFCKSRNKAKPVHAATLFAQQTLCLTWERVMPPLLLLSMRGLTGNPISFSRSPCSCRAVSKHIGTYTGTDTDTHTPTQPSMHILLRNILRS